ncbi:transposase [Streptomyces sp. NPDC002701]|uniref:IS110 family transposase n=1 Tax=Streptomyces sp. NPDC002701 TaxID=3364661 RepID=UPI0036BADE10
MIWAGIDAGKTHHYCVAIDESGHRLPSRHAANDEPELLELIADVLDLSDEVTWGIDLADDGAALAITILFNHDQPVHYMPCRGTRERGSGKNFVGGDHLGATVDQTAGRAACECALWNWSACYRGFLMCRWPLLRVPMLWWRFRARTRSGEPAGCTGSGQLSAWCHGRYARRRADVTLAGRPLRIDLSVRRLYCESTTCLKATFAEQVPALTIRYQRRTPRLQRLVEDIGVMLAGRGGSRMLRILNIRLLRVAVLSQLTRVPLPPLITPRVLGGATTSLSTAAPTARSSSTPRPGSHSHFGYGSTSAETGSSLTACLCACGRAACGYGCRPSGRTGAGWCDPIGFRGVGPR